MALSEGTVGDRVKSGFAAVLVQGALLYALVVGLGVQLPRVVGDELKMFAVGPAPPPPPPVERVKPRPVKSTKPEGAASPPNLRSKATELVAPPPVLMPIVPPPVVVATKAGVGNDASSGAADIAGPGTGAGGFGTGTGGGGYGDGDGDGGAETPPRQRKGRIKDSDYPRGAGEQGAGGTVGVRYTVGVDGRASQCRVTHSSGSAELDATTCRLIEQRFRFDPSRDARGRAVPSTLVEDHEWVVHDEGPLPDR